jgi:hypothetical protein
MGVFDPPDLSQADVTDLVAELRRRRPLPLGLLRNGTWFKTAPYSDDGGVGVKLRGSMELDPTVQFLPGNSTVGVGRYQVSSLTLVYPIRDPRESATPAPVKLPEPESGSAPDDDKSPVVTTTPRRGQVGIPEMLASGVLMTTDVLVCRVGENTRECAIGGDGTIVVGRATYTSVSAAALSAMETLGKRRAATNGWTSFHVIRSGTDIGVLADLRERVK